MRVTFSRDRRFSSHEAYYINAGENIAGFVKRSYSQGPWVVDIWPWKQHHYDAEQLNLIRAAAEKKCTTLNILRRLTS